MTHKQVHRLQDAAWKAVKDRDAALAGAHIVRIQALIAHPRFEPRYEALWKGAITWLEEHKKGLAPTVLRRLERAEYVLSR